MNATGDFGDISDFTISSANEGDLSDKESQLSEGALTPNNAYRAQGDQLGDARILKIELSRKSFELEKYKKDFIEREEELHERIEALVQQREGIQRQLEHEVRMNQEQTVKRAQYIQDQLDRATKQQQYLESTNSKLVQSTIELKDVLSHNLHISQSEYDVLKARSEYELSVRELIQLKVFDTMQPLAKEIRNLKYENLRLTTDSEEYLNEGNHLRSTLGDLEENYKQLQQEFKTVVLDLSSTKDKVQIGNYKVENFDKIQRANDQLEEKYGSTKSDLDKLKVHFASLERERDELIRNLSDLNQSHRLMLLDKDYLTKQVNELVCRSNNAEERLQTAWRQLEETKTSREQLYDKYVSSRDEFRTQYENRLREELDSLRLKTEHEMEKIKINTRELYDRDLKGLTDAKDISVAERDIAVRNLRELEERFEKTKLEYSMYQSSADNKISELLNDIKMKSFESERTNILYDECCNKLKLAALDCEKFQAKFDMITKEYYQMECDSSKRISELEMKLDHASKKLISYERLEEELDLAVMHAAENDDGRPVLMWPHGYDSGSQLPTQVGRRMQQSIELARKILHLERMLRERNHTLEEQSKELERVRQELERSESILSEAKQPYTYLIDALRKRDAEMNKLKLINSDCIAQLNKVRQEKSKLSEEKNRMTTDFEQLLSQKEELLKLRRIFEELRKEQCVNNDLVVTKLPKCTTRVDPTMHDIPQPGRHRLQDYAVSRT